MFEDLLSDFWNSHGAKCPGIKFGEIETSYFARHTDDDIANVLNFLIDPPNEELAYPELVYTGDTTIKTKSLIIADSFYWTFMYLSLHEKMFGKGSSFWYYNRTAWPKFQKPDVYVQNLDLRSEILKRDLIIFFVAECNLPYFGWGFVESANEVLK